MEPESGSRDRYQPPSVTGAAGPESPWVVTPNRAPPKNCAGARPEGRAPAHGSVGGDEGSRTLDLRIANAPLYQLSYVPNRGEEDSVATALWEELRPRAGPAARSSAESQPATVASLALAGGAPHRGVTHSTSTTSARQSSDLGPPCPRRASGLPARRPSGVSLGAPRDLRRARTQWPGRVEERVP